MAAARSRRCAWEDRFSQPTESEALAHYNRQLGGCANAARLLLRNCLNVPERLVWKGIPWRWTFVYARPAAAVEAYLVPLPAAPRLVIALPSASSPPFVDRHAPRVIRDAFQNAVRVGEFLWPSWDLSVRAQVQELAGMLESMSQIGLAAEGAA